MKKIYFILIFTALTVNAFCQKSRRDRGETFKNVITAEPLYLFNNGLKINYERRLFAHNWVEVSVVGYKYDKESFQNVWGAPYFWDNDIDRGYGYGADLHYKWFPLQFMYLSCGVQLRHHKISADDYTYGFSSYEEDGMTYYYPSLRSVSQYVNHFSTCLRLGFQTRPFRRVSVGGFIGFNYVRSSTNDTFYNYWTDDDVFSLTYNGLMPELGFKIGVRF